MSAKIEAEEKHIELLSEILEIKLTPELVEKIDDAVRLLDFGSREELILCAIRRHVDLNFIIPKSTLRTR